MNYGAGWKAIKRQVRERDHLCQGWGKTPKENGRALDVHHIQPFRYSADNSLDNLMALCRSCHMRANDHGRRGHARFAGPEQILKPLSNADLKKIRAKEERSRRWQWHERAFALHDRGKSLRQIACELNVSHQTIANWLSARHELRASVN